MKNYVATVVMFTSLGLLFSHEVWGRAPRIYGSSNRTACSRPAPTCKPAIVTDTHCSSCDRLEAARCNPYKRFWGGKGAYYPQARQRVGTWSWGWPHRAGVGYFYEGTGANSRW